MAICHRGGVQIICFIYTCALLMFSLVSCLTESQIEELEQLVKTSLKCRTLPAMSLTLVKNGKIVMSKTFGKADPGKDIDAQDDTKFCIGSLTKAFTATVLSKLVTERSNVTFDTPVREILGQSFKLSDDVRTNLVSLRDLLSHRVGVPSYFKALLVGFPETIERSEVVRRLRFMPATEPLRTKFLYNNYMYTLAGHIAEKMGGATWENLVQKYILSPLGMDESGFIDKLHNFTNFAVPVAKKDGKLVSLDPTILHSVHPCGPAGSIYSTGHDMGKWMQLLLNEGTTPGGKKLFASGVIKRTQEPGMPAPLLQENLKRPEFPVGDVQMFYDMAWVTSVYRGFKLVWHSGGIMTHSSRLWMFPDKNIAIYAAANGGQTHDKSLGLRAVLSYAADLLLGENPWINASTLCTFPSPWGEQFKATAPPKVTDSMTVTARPLEDYTGTYYHRGFGEIIIRLKEGTTDALMMSYGRFGTLNLYPLSETLFHGRFYGPLWFMSDSDNQFEPETIEFIKHKDNKISGLIYSIDAQYNNTLFSRGNYYPIDTYATYKFPCPSTSECFVCQPHGVIVLLGAYIIYLTLPV